MGAFLEILPFFGVDAANGFMMVPVKGINLIYHSLGKGTTFTVTTGTHSLSVKDVTDEILKGADASKIFENPNQPLFVDKDDMTAFVLAAFRRSSEPSLRLWAVSTNTLGKYIVTLKSPRRSESLTVLALNERTTKISFRYLKYVGKWPPPGATEKNISNYSKGVTRTKAEGEKYGKLLKQLFRHQANITVTFQSSDDVGLESPFGPVMTNEFFKKNLLPKKDTSANTTIFVVPQIEGAEGRSMIDNDPTGLMVAENPKVVWSGDAGDPFLFTSAHELAHPLGGVHKDKDGLLLSGPKQKQGFLIGEDTLKEINPPPKR